MAIFTISIIFILLFILLFAKLYYEFRNRGMYNKSKVEEKYEQEFFNFISLLGILIYALKKEKQIISPEDNKNLESLIEHTVNSIQSNKIRSKNKLKKYLLSEYTKMIEDEISLQKYTSYLLKQNKNIREDAVLQLSLFLFSREKYKNKEEVIYEIGGNLNIPQHELDNLITTLKNNNKNNQSKQIKKDPYSILGCKSNDSIEVIKKQYKISIRKYHPDYLQSKDLDNDFIEFAKNKIQEINEAYSIIKKEKGI